MFAFVAQPLLRSWDTIVRAVHCFQQPRYRTPHASTHILLAAQMLRVYNFPPSQDIERLTDVPKLRRGDPWATGYTWDLLTANLGREITQQCAITTST